MNSESVTPDYEFLEPKYEEIYHLITTHDGRNGEQQVSSISFDELLSTQYHEKLCSNICVLINEGRRRL